MARSDLQINYRTIKSGTGGKEAQAELAAFNKTAKGTQMSLADVKAGVDLAAQAFQVVQGAVRSVIEPTVGLATEVRDLSRLIGATPEEASKLIAAAGDMGISADKLGTALAAAIRKGVSPTIEGISELADEYNAIQDPIERSKFLLDRFGRAGADMGELLEKGSEGIAAMGEEAERLGLVLDQDALDAAKEYELAMDDLNDSFTGLKISIGREVLPALTVFTEAATAGSTTVSQMVRGLASGSLSMEEFGRAAFLAAIPTRNRLGAAMDYLDGAALPLAEKLRSVIDRTNTLGITAGLAVEPTKNLALQAKDLGDNLGKAATGMSDLEASTRSYLDNAGNQAAGALQDAGVSAQTYYAGLVAIDSALGTGLANEEETQRKLEAINAEFARTKDVEAYEAALIRLFKSAKEQADTAKGPITDVNNELLGVGAKLAALDGKVATITIKTVYVEEGKPGNTNKNGDGGTAAGSNDKNFAGGVQNFIVPPGHPNDSYRIGVSSGEVVNVTPTQNNNFQFTHHFDGGLNENRIVALVSARVAADTRAALRARGKG